MAKTSSKGSQPVNPLKSTLKKNKIIQKKYKLAQEDVHKKRGLIYVSHIPHGFFEMQMKDYFNQFGRVTNILLCRSGKTGNSKGYGYVEFQNPKVAKIVARAMDNYVMFKKRLVVQLVPYEERPKQLFHGNYNTAGNYATKRKRLRDISAKNKIIPDETVLKRAKNAIQKLNKRLQKLHKSGITCNVEPVSVPLPIKQEKVSKPNSECDESDDSEIEFRIPKVEPQSSEHSKSPSTSSSTSRNYKDRNSKALVTKSVDSVKNLVKKTSSDRSDNVPLISSPKGNSLIVKKHKRVSKQGITKKPVKLNSDTVKKIARELIRKKGTPLLNLISTNKHTKKASKKK